MHAGRAPLHLLAVIVLLLAGPPALAQTSAVERVRAAAPELVGFAGSADNFASLVTGLARVSDVTLTTPLADGYVQVVQFRPPGGPLGAEAIVSILRSANRRLAALGLRNPDGQQVAAVLTGGVVETPSASVRVAGLLPLAGEGDQPGYRLIREEPAPPREVLPPPELTPTLELGPPPDPNLVLFAGSLRNLRSLVKGLTDGEPIVLTGETSPGVPQTIVFTVPLRPLSPAGATALIERARLALAREAIAAPTPQQIRTAILALV